MNAIPTIKRVMTPFPYHIEQDKSLIEARELMHSHGIRHLPVTNNTELVGVISERDITLALSLAKHFVDEKDIPVSDACTFHPFTVELETRLDVVVLEMAKRHIGSVVVMKAGKLAGIFTTTDACQCYGEFLQSFLVSPSDQDPEIA